MPLKYLCSRRLLLSEANSRTGQPFEADAAKCPSSDKKDKIRNLTEWTTVCMHLQHPGIRKTNEVGCRDKTPTLTRSVIRQPIIDGRHHSDSQKTLIVHGGPNLAIQPYTFTARAILSRYWLSTDVCVRHKPALYGNGWNDRDGFWRRGFLPAFRLLELGFLST